MEDLIQREPGAGGREGADRQVVREFGRLSTEWRKATEAFTDRFDGHHQDLKDRIQSRIDLTRMVYAAARSPDARLEVDDNLRFLMAYLLRDLRRAYEAAEAVAGGVPGEAGQPAGVGSGSIPGQRMGRPRG